MPRPASEEVKMDQPPIITIAGQQGKFIDGPFFCKPLRVYEGNEASEQLFYEIVLGTSKSVGKATVLSILKLLSPYIPHYVGTRVVKTDKLPNQPVGTPTSDQFIVLENVFADYKRPACLDLKITLPSRPKHMVRIGTGNLLGCYIHGVEADHVRFQNRFNQFTGRNKPIDHFHLTLKKFFSKCNATDAQRRELLTKMKSLASILSRLSMLGFNFVSSSILFVYDQHVDPNIQTPPAPNLYLVDFERTLFRGLALARYLATPDAIECPFRTLEDAETVLAKQLPYLNDPLSRASRVMTHILREILFPNEFAVTVYLVRHGERHDYTDHSWALKSPHPHDAHLSDAGVRQSEDFVDRLRHLKIHRLVSAPMQRAVLGAEPIASATRSLISIEPGFCEFLCSKTRTRVPSLFSNDVSISPFVDDSYQPYWPAVNLESWPDVFTRSEVAVNGLVEECRQARGDLVIVSHRSTLQTVFKALLPDFEDDTMLEYGGLSMISETEPGSGKFEMVTFNEMAHLRDRIRSPSSNPWRHIEGYYSDLSWSSYKSTSEMWSDPKEEEKK
jgi:broad specificity phosphatase PhoE